MTILVAPSGDRATLDAAAWVRSVGRPGPERWLWWLSGAAWVYLLVGAAAADLTALGVTGSSGAHDQMRMGSSPVTSALDTGLMWVAMVVATMLPLVAWNVRYAGLRSPLGRRTRATREVVAGWTWAWAAGSVVLLGGIWASQRLLGDVWTLVVAFALAALWQLTGVRRRALARCHRTLAPPLGSAATPACHRFGWQLGRDCFTTCWPLMAAMGVAGHELLVMVILAWLSWRDRRLPHDQPGHGTTMLLLAVAAGVGFLAV